jgi:Ca-activated chloride channel family protein
MTSVRELLGGVIAALRGLQHEGLKGITLGTPLALLVVAILVVSFISWLRYHRPPPTLLFARGDDAAAMPRGFGHVAHRVVTAAAFLGLLLGALALTDPTVLGEPEPGSTEGIDVVVALDVSGSMRAADFRPKDRLFVAKKVIQDQVLSRQRDRVGLVVFAGEAFTQAPLTHDKGLLADILQGVRTGVITDGTAIGDGLATSLNRLKDSKAKTKAVILLSDGDNNAGFIAPESATDLAVDLGVKVFTILVGKGGKVPFPDGTDIFGAPRYVTVDMPVNPTLLKTIATRTGGSFFNATDAESLKASFTKILDNLDRSLLEGARPVRRPIPLAPLLLLPAALLFSLALLLTFTRASTVP